MRFRPGLPQLVAALAARDTETMDSLYAEDYVVDWVYGDAFENPPVSAEESAAFVALR